MQKIYQKNNDATKIKSDISGCYLLNLTKNIDQRGYFFNILSKNLFFDNYSLTSIKQINISKKKCRKLDAFNGALSWLVLAPQHSPWKGFGSRDQVSCLRSLPWNPSQVSKPQKRIPKQKGSATFQVPSKQ